MVKKNIVISIITVTLNSEKFLDEYFSSILANPIFKEQKAEILIYDGGSTDSSLKIIEKYRKKGDGSIKVKQGGNIGFTKANNLLAKGARGEYLFILNPDTVLDSNCLQYLLAEKSKDSALLIPTQKLFSGKYLSQGCGMDIFGYPYGKKLFFVDGAGIFLRKDLFVGLGMFDDDYFIFNEDIDLSWRARLKDVPLVIVPKAIFYHFCGGYVVGSLVREEKYTTSYMRRYLNEKNTITNLLKNYSLHNLLWIFPINLLLNIIEAFIFLIALKPKVSFCYVRAYWWNIANLDKTLKKRKNVQTTRIISDRVIMKNMYLGAGKFWTFFRTGIPKFK